MPDWNLIATIVGVVAAVFGIYLKQRADNAKAFGEMATRLTSIEIKLQIDDNSRANGVCAAETAQELKLLKHCAAQREACPALKEHRDWVSPSQVITEPGKP